MEITIAKEDTGKEDYFEFKNLLTKALEREGFKKVYLQPNEWNGKKKFFFGLLEFTYEGVITPKATNTIYQLSTEKQDRDTVVDLEKE